MRLFPNPTGTGILYFDNLTSQDGMAVAYDPNRKAFLTEATFCANRDRISCNWVATPAGSLCEACAMTSLSPDLSMPGAIGNWANAEAAKRWVLDNLRNWNWFAPADTGPVPVFHMLAEGVNPVVMGHANGVLTISIEESDPVVRIARRAALAERYRTMIGHMRHEIAHFLWWRLGIVPGFTDAFRALFGDERSDYTTALETYYGNGPPPDWQNHFLTPYAAAHPHEDWAETTAHLLHLIDITDSFLATGFSTPEIPGAGWDPYHEPDLATLLNVATAIAVGSNLVNRSMGLPDLYPFVLCEAYRQKLEFVLRWLRGGGSQRPG